MYIYFTHVHTHHTLHTHTHVRTHYKQVFYKCLGLSQSVAKESFKAIDTDSNGFISKPELLKAYEEFLWGVDENAPGNMFFGPLIDYI